MKKMENSLNILHFCIYKFHYNLHLGFNKVNPFMLIHKLPFQKRRYEKLGIDIIGNINQAFGDRRFGLSIMVSGGTILGILFILILAVANIVIKTMNLDLTLSIGHFLMFVLLSSATCYSFVFKREKYLYYFELYERWTKTEKMKYGWSSFMFIMAVFLLLVLGFI